MENRELDLYLAKLERALGSISVSEKAEIIMEIKSHVMDALENHSDRSVSEILRGLGEPEQVANRYLLERGLEPVKPPRSSTIKWLVIGFLGTLSILVVSTFVLIFSLTPLVEVNEEEGKVKILGGMIKINEIDDFDGDFSFDLSDLEGLEDQLEGLELKVGSKDSSEIDLGSAKTFSVELSNSNTKMENTESKTLKYSCSSLKKAKIDKNLDKVTFDLKNSPFSNCKFEIPKGVKVEARAQNGNLKFSGIENSLKVDLMNGLVKFIPNADSSYSYDLSVQNGSVADFVSSTDKNAYKVQVSIMNGKIKN